MANTKGGHTLILSTNNHAVLTAGLSALKDIIKAHLGTKHDKMVDFAVGFDYARA